MTEPTSKYIDYFVKSLTCSLEAYLQKQTKKKLLQKLQYSANFLLVTVDIEAFYSNTDHDEGLFTLPPEKNQPQ